MALISQVLVALMVFVRELWIQQTDWDQILTPLIQQRVTRPLLESGTIRYFEVPRWIGNGPDGDIQLNVFLEAAKAAYYAAA